MNILIVAKNYHQKNDARAIQMRKVFAALQTYSRNNFVLITEGCVEFNSKNVKNKVINIPARKEKFSPLINIINKKFINTYIIKRSRFIVEAVRISKKMIFSGEIDLLMTVSFPSESHIVGLELKKSYPDLKWITFFSDLWPTSLLPEPYKRKKILSGVELNVMKKIIEGSNLLLTPSKYSLEILKRFFRDSRVYQTVPHCGPESYISNLNLSLDGYIVHSGFLQKERIEEELVDAIIELGAEVPEFNGLIHIGHYSSKIEKMIKAKNCKNFFLLDQLPEEMASILQSMCKASIIIEADMKGCSPFMPSKITNSLNPGKQLIMITPHKSFLRDFAAEQKGIYCCSYNKNDIKKCIIESLKSSETIASDSSDFFHPRNVSHKYDELFNSLL